MYGVAVIDMTVIVLVSDAIAVVITDVTATRMVGTSLLCLFFHLLCYAAVLKILTYYAQYYAHVCLKFDCSIRVYSQNY